jgi:hypothetical protein
LPRDTVKAVAAAGSSATAMDALGSGQLSLTEAAGCRRSYRCGIQIVHPISDSAAEVSSQPRCFTERRRTDT